MNRRLALFGLLLAGLVLAPSATHGGSKTPSRLYVHVRIGFSMKIIPDWSETPTSADYKARGAVARFKSDDRGREYATLDVYRFGSALQETTLTEEGGADESPEAQWRKWQQDAMRAKSAEEALRSMVDGMVERINQNLEAIKQRGGPQEDPIPPVDLSKPRKIKLGKAEGEMYQFTIGYPKSIGYGSQSFMAGIARKADEEYLVLFSCPDNQMKGYQGSFSYSIRSFRFPDETKTRRPSDDEEEPAVDENSELLGAEKRARIKHDLTAEKWRTLDTPHYIILYHEEDRNLARAVATRIERLRTELWEKDFPPVKPIEDVMVIRLCPDMQTYQHYGGPPGTGGYWSSGDDEFVFPSFTGRDRKDDTTLGVLHHEGWHQYFHYALGGRETPIAMNEGLAEYYFCAEPRGRGFVIGDHHPMRTDVVRGNIAKLKPVKEFLRLTQMQHYSQASLCYAEGWALFYWLMKGTRNPEYQAIPRKLFENLQTLGWREAIDKTLEGIDEDKLNEDFLKDLKRIL